MGEVAQNPVLPAAYDIVWSAVVVIYFIAILALCLHVARTTSLSSSNRVLWILVIVAAPVVGAIAWYASAEWRRQNQGRDVGSQSPR